ncbi:MAG: hypothetical protein EOQ92_28870 [Mesorhizobium sp.]|uniref:hypothetical protein n=1 Tax=Mesorhizobium sp. TaxID=1871066 RepID=UPI000FE5B679|nr:hypothetical protein [Mesorhizobium sp.]RWI14448.1 MAG: hypothetical protein EOQ92_28870 [Mesorhizobium sp.]RWK45160.1 MAG: hypothetical protein EOR47_32330 [Mesorhizobium sp.]RWK52359.1 MAG: hypothetical protein EOR48_23920 [Mesorhizobium sp.]RWK88663.1 MAG: hypothetical protein EOR53_33640 [Mesorhizobium sp.]TIP83521.1 MAG: hypothetical protein E5X58_37505 [Mesorhizobium sp.]
MVRRRRISEYHLARIERQACLLKHELRDAQLALKPFVEHWEVIIQLHRDINRALNVLNGRPADYEEPHAAPMSRG